MQLTDEAVDRAIYAYRAALPTWCRGGEYHDVSHVSNDELSRPGRGGWRRDLRIAMREALLASGAFFPETTP